MSSEKIRTHIFLPCLYEVRSCLTTDHSLIFTPPITTMPGWRIVEKS